MVIIANLYRTAAAIVCCQCEVIDYEFYNYIHFCWYVGILYTVCIPYVYHNVES